MDHGRSLALAFAPEYRRKSNVSLRRKRQYRRR